MIIPFYNAIGAQRINSGGGAAPLVNTKSLAFDGVDDFVSVGNVIDKSKSTPFSISLWVKISGTFVNNIMISKTQDQGGTLGQAGFELYFNNQLYFLFALDSHFSHVMYVKDNNYWGADFINNWHHIVATYDGSGLSSGMTLYVDGYDVSFARVDTGTGDFDNTGSLRIGGQEAFGYPCNPAFFNGKIDEPCIMPIELSAPEVLDIYNGVRPSGGGTGAPWNDGTGVPKDMSSYTPDGWWRNGDNSTYQTPQILMPENTNKDKVSNFSMDFDGTDDYIDCGNGSELQITSDISVSCWFKTTSTGTEMLISKRILGIGTGYGYQLYIGAKLLRFLVTLNGPVTYTATGITEINDGQWHHVLGTIDQNNQISIILDGSTEATSALGSEAFVESNSSLLLGYNQVGASHYYFEGQMDEVAIFDSLESGSTIYNLGTPSDITSLNPNAYWKLGEGSKFTSQWLVPNQMSQDTAFNFGDRTQSEYISLSQLPLYNAITVSAWIKTQKNGVSFQTIISNNQPNAIPNEKGWALTIGAGWASGYTKAQFIFMDSGGVTTASLDQSSAQLLTDNQWHHVVALWDGTTDANAIKIFVDGLLAGQGISAFAGPINQPVAIFEPRIGIAGIGFGGAGGGSVFGGDAGEDGYISNVQTWDTALTYGAASSIGDVAGGNIAQLYNSGFPLGTAIVSDDLQSWWKLDSSATFDGANWSIPDDSDNTNTGTSFGMTQANLVRTPISFSNVYSKFSFDFDGVDDTITTGLDCSSATHPSITVSCWLKYPAEPPYHYGIYYAAGVQSQNGFYQGLGLMNSGAIANKANGMWTTGTNLRDNTWHNVIWVSEYNTPSAGNLTMTVYLDGNTTPDISTIDTSGGQLIGDLFIGSYDGTAQYFDGNIDSVAVWNSALTTADVTTIYNSGQPADLTSLSPLAWWRLGEDATYNAAVGVSGNTTADDAAGYSLIDTGVDFTTLNVEIGDLVHNTTTSSISRVNTIAHTFMIILDDAIFPSGSTGDGYKITGPVVWTVPDQIGSNDGTSANMSIQDLQGEAPNYSGAGTSSNMYIEDRVGDAPNSENNALSYNMLPDDIDPDVPS